MIRSKRFADLVTGWKYNAFFRSRIQLTILYSIILGCVLIVNAALVYIASNASFAGIQTISHQEARQIAQNYQDKSIDEIEKEHEGATIIYSVEYTDGEEIEIDGISGKIIQTPGTHKSFQEEFFESFLENLAWINGAIFIVCAILSYILAGKTLAPIQQKIHEQDRFVADAAHELRNPLAAIILSLENVGAQSKEKETIDEIIQESHRLSRITEDLLHLSEAKQKNKDLGNKKISLLPIIEEVANELLSFARTKNIHIHTKGTSVETQGRNDDWQKVLFNLVHNAIKFADENTRVTIHLKPKEISIHNLGNPIPKEEQEKIFERFYKADQARTTTKHSGSGIGLSIVQQILHNYGHRISVTSEKKEGTTFTIMLV